MGIGDHMNFHRHILCLVLLLCVLSVRANQVSQVLQNPHRGDFMFCRGELDPKRITYLLTLDGEVYTSNSAEENPARILDFSLFTNFKLLKPDRNEMYVYTINQKKYKADFVAHVETLSLHFVLSYQDDDNNHSSGYLLKDGQELEISCFDVSQYLEKLKM